MPTRTLVQQIGILLLLTVAALMIHGYHPYVEDAEIYVPGITKALDPSLYPFNSAFFTSHARLTFFPNLIAGSIRLTGIPLEWALVLWHCLSVFLLLLASWRLAHLCFRDPLASWGSAGMIAALLTIPVAGTALLIMDQYLTPRSLSTPAALFIVISVLRKNFWRAALGAAFIALIHPLMAGFALSYVAMLELVRRWPRTLKPAAWLLGPLGLFPPMTSAYRVALDRHSYFFLLRWQWYEWLGIFGPLVLLYLFHQVARKKQLSDLALLCRSLILFELFYFVVALIITIPPRLANLTELQPMRCLHPLYVLLFVFTGGFLVQFVLKNKTWRWIALFLPLGAGMCYAQLQSFPMSSHIEWPATSSRNPWVQAFVWARNHTPTDAYFALNPDYMRVPGEDQHGFRAMAERSRLADRTKDSGAVTMFPALAEIWFQQVAAENGWSQFDAQDFRRLKSLYGVNWAIVEHPPAGDGLSCPYANSAVSVCAIP